MGEMEEKGEDGDVGNGDTGIRFSKLLYAKNEPKQQFSNIKILHIGCPPKHVISQTT